MPKVVAAVASTSAGRVLHDGTRRGKVLVDYVIIELTCILNSFVANKMKQCMISCCMVTKPYSQGISYMAGVQLQFRKKMWFYHKYLVRHRQIIIPLKYANMLFPELF